MRQIAYPALILFGLASVVLAAQEIRDPIKEAARKRDHQMTQQNYSELKEASNQLARLSKELSDEVEASSEHVINARIFDRLDKIEKLTKTIRSKAKGPLKPEEPLKLPAGRQN